MAKVIALQKRGWIEELEKSGLSFVQPKPSASGDGVSCPACGTTAPLNDGACSDCGLYLG